MRRSTTLAGGVCAVSAAMFLSAAGHPRVAAQSPASAGAALYEGARLIDGNGGPAAENAAFVVENGRITQVGRAGQLKAPAGATTVNLGGKTVMPAIIDTHVHAGDSRDVVIEQLRAKAYYGVSAVMSLGTDPGDVALKLRDETIPGAARLRTAGRGITSPEPGRTEVPYWVTTDADARKAVQELAARKVDIVKIWVDDRDGKYKKLSPELYGAVIDEAHKHKLRVTAHIFTLADAKGLLRAGVDAFAHGVRDMDVDDEFLSLMKARPQVVLVPNMPDRGVKADLAWLRPSMRSGEWQKLQDASTDRPEAQKAFGIQARNLDKLNRAGVKIALGTDGMIVWSQHAEMADMVSAGMTPGQVIVASTRNAAEFMRLSDAGTIATGKSADFLVLDANPLDDITNTRRIASVYLRGAAVDRDGLRTRWTTTSP